MKDPQEPLPAFGSDEFPAEERDDLAVDFDEDFVDASDEETAVASPGGSASRPRRTLQRKEEIESRASQDVGADEFFVVGRYEVHQAIASGGMASVHLGRLRGAAGFSRTVAIKRMHRHFAQDPDFEAMFTDEARLAARVQHPNVLSTVDVVSAEGELLLIMEYVHGEALSLLLHEMEKNGEKLPPELTVSILSGVLHGLHAAHNAVDRYARLLGLVHRDVSPQNIMVGVDGIARVLDFGIAKAADCLHTTRDGQVRGKAAYMAPEQLYGENVDRRTDVYSAGVVLWEMLVGQRMFDDSDQAALLKIAEAKIEPPSARISGLSPAFDRVTMRALQKDRRDRYPSALEMAEALETCARVATRTDVRQWVERLAGEALSERAVKVANVEAVGDSQPPTARSNPSGRTGSGGRVELTTTRGLSTHHRLAASARRTKVLAAFGGGALLASLGFGVWFFQGGRAGRSPSLPDRSALSPTSGPSTPSLADSVPAQPESERQSDTTVVSVESLPYVGPPAAAANPTTQTPKATSRGTSKTRTSTGGVNTRKPTRPKPAKPKPNCDPPYTIDASGTKRFKIECF